MPGTRNRAGLFLVYFFVCSLRSRSQKLVSATASQASLRSRQFKSGKCNFKSDKSFVRCAQVKFKDGNRNRNRNRNRNPRSSMDSRTSRTTPGRRWIHEHQVQLPSTDLRLHTLAQSTQMSTDLHGLVLPDVPDSTKSVANVSTPKVFPTRMFRVPLFARLRWGFYICSLLLFFLIYN